MLARVSLHVAPVTARSRSVEETAVLLPGGALWENVAQSVIVSVSVRKLMVDVNKLPERVRSFLGFAYPKCVPFRRKSAYPYLQKLRTL